MAVHDYFSKVADLYSKHRPHYPSELFEFLASVTPAHQLVWDCGTGNGQAALALTRHFEKIFATDVSPEQIANAFSHKKIEYHVLPVESVPLEEESVDLVTAAAAVHWFDLDKFYPEVKRVLKPDGILAVWSYHLPRINDEIDAVLSDYYWEVLKGYWPAPFRYLEDKYHSLPFPFENVEFPDFYIQAEWNLEQLNGFISSWSATRRYLDAKGQHPLEKVADRLLAAWGEPRTKHLITWNLYMRVGRR